LSFEAKGLLVELLSRPENWTIHKSQFNRRSAGRHKINRIFAELRNAGYLQIEVVRGSDNRITDNVWTAADMPIFNTYQGQKKEKSVDSPNDGKTERRKTRTPENLPLQSTYSLQNTEKEKKKEPPSQTAKANPLLKEYDVLLRLDPELRSELSRSPQTEDIKNLVFTVKKMLDQFGVNKILAAWEVLQAGEWYREEGYANVWYLFGDERKAAVKIRSLLAKRAGEAVNEEKLVFVNA
jgi:hypothetical protein